MHPVFGNRELFETFIKAFPKMQKSVCIERNDFSYFGKDPRFKGGYNLLVRINPVKSEIEDRTVYIVTIDEYAEKETKK